MSMKNTRDILLERLSQQTKMVDFSALDEFCASSLASRLGVSRNLISQYLNELFSQGKLVKINTRPVYFFCRQALEETGKEYLTEYASAEEFQAVYGNSKKTSVFSEFIGVDGSLSYCVDQCKAAITYPGRGLPILLQGSTGTGKSMLAQCMYEYAKEQGVISPKGKFVVVNCSEYANNPELLLTNLFGYTKGAYTGADKQRSGLVALADGGVLFLDEVHCLKPECQEKLFLFMDKGTYHMVGDNEKWYESQVRFIFATTEKPEQALLKTFLRRIPLVTVLPSLEKRPLFEKKQLLHRLFLKESQAIEKEIVISRSTYLALEQFPFPENVGQLANGIKTSVANAFLRCNQEDKEQVSVYTYDLPEYILQNVVFLRELGELDNKTMLSLNQMKLGIFWGNSLYRFNQDLLTILQRSLSEESMELVWTKFSAYLDFLFYEKQESINPKDNFYYRMLQNVSGILAQKQGVSYTSSQLSKLERFIRDYRQNRVTISTLFEFHQQEMKQIVTWIETQYPTDWDFAAEFKVLLEDSLNLSFDLLGQLDLFLLLKSFCKNTVSYTTTAILLARGYSTASSLSTAINQLLGETIFIPLDISVKATEAEIMKKILMEIEAQKKPEEYIILSDMTLADSLQQAIENLKGCNIGIIQNITTDFALKIGEHIKQNKTAKEILSEIELIPQTHPLFFENRKKETAILSICATGIGTAKKISDLMKKSFPTDSEIHFVQYDYDSIMSMGETCPIFSQYEILFIVGTMNPQTKAYPFISVEELVQQKNADLINRLLSKVLNKEQLTLFNQNLIKNFSLQNLLQYLTILNPEKIINHVEQILAEIQHQLNITLSSSAVVGLYLHISCLIERLITNRYIASYQDIEQFQRKHNDFIKIVKAAFSEVEESYYVEIPISEIGYLYSYIFK